MSSRRGLGLSGDYMNKAYAKGRRTLANQRQDEDEKAAKKNSQEATPSVETLSEPGLVDGIRATKKNAKSEGNGFAGLSAGFLSKGKDTKRNDKKNSPGLAAKVSKEAIVTSPVAGNAEGVVVPSLSSRVVPDEPKAAMNSARDEKDEPRVPFVKAAEKIKGNESGLRFKEVEEAMQGPASSFLKAREGEWLTPDLLDQVARDPILSKMMSNPKFVHILAEFQADPKGTLQKYDKDGGVMGDFLRRFCGLMGEHMGKMAEKEDAKAQVQATSPKVEEQRPLIRESQAKQPAGAMDETRFQEIMQDKQVQAVFQMPAVQNLFQMLTSNPAQAQQLLRSNKDARFQRAVALLVSKGLFQVQSM